MGDSEVAGCPATVTEEVLAGRLVVRLVHPELLLTFSDG